MKLVPVVPEYSSSAHPMPTAGECSSPTPEPTNPLLKVLPFNPSASNKRKHKLAELNVNNDSGLESQVKRKRDGGVRQRQEQRCPKCGMSAGSSAMCRGMGPGGVSKCQNTVEGWNAGGETAGIRTNLVLTKLQAVQMNRELTIGFLTGQPGAGCQHRSIVLCVSHT